MPLLWWFSDDNAIPYQSLTIILGMGSANETTLQRKVFSNWLSPCSEGSSHSPLQMNLLPGDNRFQSIGQSRAPCFPHGSEHSAKLEHLSRKQPWPEDRLDGENSHHINGSAEDCSNSTAFAMELSQYCAKPLIQHGVWCYSLQRKTVNLLWPSDAIW